MVCLYIVCSINQNAVLYRTYDKKLHDKICKFPYNEYIHLYNDAAWNFNDFITGYKYLYDSKDLPKINKKCLDHHYSKNFNDKIHECMNEIIELRDKCMMNENGELENQKQLVTTIKLLTRLFIDMLISINYSYSEIGIILFSYKYKKINLTDQDISKLIVLMKELIPMIETTLFHLINSNYFQSVQNIMKTKTLNIQHFVHLNLFTLQKICIPYKKLLESYESSNDSHIEQLLDIKEILDLFDDLIQFKPNQQLNDNPNIFTLINVVFCLIADNDQLFKKNDSLEMLYVLWKLDKIIYCKKYVQYLHRIKSTFFKSLIHDIHFIHLRNKLQRQMVCDEIIKKSFLTKSSLHLGVRRKRLMILTLNRIECYKQDKKEQLTLTELFFIVDIKKITLNPKNDLEFILVINNKNRSFIANNKTERDEWVSKIQYVCGFSKDEDKRWSNERVLIQGFIRNHTIGDIKSTAFSNNIDSYFFIPSSVIDLICAYFFQFK